MMIKRPRRRAKTIGETGIYEPYEDEICISFYYKYLMLKLYNQLPNVFILHIANERKTSKSYGTHLKRMGVVSGASDYLIVLRYRPCEFIEFKRTSKDKLKPKQIKFKETMQELGINCHLMWCADTAINLLLKLNGS